MWTEAVNVQAWILASSDGNLGNGQNFIKKQPASTNLRGAEQSYTSHTKTLILKFGQLSSAEQIFQKASALLRLSPTLMVVN